MTISSEKAFDLLPIACDIYEKLDFEKFSKTLKKGITQKEAGIKVMLYVLKNSGKIKEEIFSIVAVLQDISIEDAKALGFIQNITILKELFTDEDTMVFFKSAMQ